jgi:hypothetical protein
MRARVVKTMKAAAVLALLGVGAGALWQCEAALTAMTGEKMYQGTGSELAVTFSYPQDWKLHQESGKTEPYQAIRIMGPRNSADTYTSHFSVYGFPLKASGGKYDSVDEMVDATKRLLPPDAQVLSEGKREIGRLPATDLTVSYTIPAIHHKGIKAAPVPVKQRKVVTGKPPYLYEISYTADAQEFDQYAEWFERLVNSFRVQ